MKRRRIRPMTITALFWLTLALAGCSTLNGPPAGHRSPTETLNAVYPDAVVLQDAAVGNDHIYLLKAHQRTTWILTMAQMDKSVTWNLQGGISVTGKLIPLGPLTFMTGDLGRVESKVGNVTTSYATETVYAGEVLDQRINWVEIAIPSEPVAPVRAQVVGDTWLVHFPWRLGRVPYPKFTIRAGNAEGELFSDTDPWHTAQRLKQSP